MATEKQKKAMENYMDNHGNVSKAMRDAGYDETTAKNPKNLTESRGWQELLDEYIPEDYLQQKLLEGLNAGRDKGEDGVEPDYATRHRYLDTAFKLRGSYAAEKQDVTSGGEPLKEITIVKNGGDKSDQETN